MSAGADGYLARHCLDLRVALREAAALPRERRLAHLLRSAGCTFHDAACRLVASPSVRMFAIGGMPFHALAAAGVTPEGAADLARESMGTAGSMSYLAMPGGDPLGAYGTIVEGHGHASVAHVATVSLLVAGVSCGVSNEFNGQRDLVHLSRVTEARTSVQDSPPVVVPHPGLAPHYAAILRATDDARSAAAREAGGWARTRDGLEALNLMHPASKATAFLLTGSLRNLQKLLDARHDPGKEREYRAALALVREPLVGLWPSLFRETAPTHDTEEDAVPGPGPR